MKENKMIVPDNIALFPAFRDLTICARKSYELVQKQEQENSPLWEAGKSSLQAGTIGGAITYAFPVVGPFAALFTLAYGGYSYYQTYACKQAASEMRGILQHSLPLINARNISIDTREVLEENLIRKISNIYVKHFCSDGFKLKSEIFAEFDRLEAGQGNRIILVMLMAIANIRGIKRSARHTHKALKETIQLIHNPSENDHELIQMARYHMCLCSIELGNNDQFEEERDLIIAYSRNNELKYTVQLTIQH